MIFVRNVNRGLLLAPLLGVLLKLLQERKVMQSSRVSSCCKKDQNKKQRPQWTVEESEFVSKTYKEHCLNIGAGKLFTSTDHLWQDIAASLNVAYENNRTKDECLKHYLQYQNGKSVMQQQQAQSQLQQQPKAKRRHIETSQAVEDKTEGSDEMASSTNENDHRQCHQSSLESFERLVQVMRQTVLEVSAIKERNSERRHRELMSMLERCLAGKAKTTVDKQCQYYDEVDMTSTSSGLNTADEFSIEQSPLHTFVPGEMDMLSMVEESIEMQDDEHEEFIEVEDEQKGPEEVELLPNQASVLVDFKTEMQILREKMLDRQRKIMEDRERKKRESLKLQSSSSK